MATTPDATCRCGVGGLAGRWYLPLVMVLAALSSIPTLLLFALGAAALGDGPPAVDLPASPTGSAVQEPCPVGQSPEVPKVGPGW